MQNKQIQIIMSVLKVSPGPFRSIHKFCSTSPDQTARMRRLIRAFAVRICLKTRFRMARLILTGTIKTRLRHSSSVIYSSDDFFYPLYIIKPLIVQFSPPESLRSGFLTIFFYPGFCCGKQKLSYLSIIFGLFTLLDLKSWHPCYLNTKLLSLKFAGLSRFCIFFFFFFILYHFLWLSL